MRPSREQDGEEKAEEDLGDEEEVEQEEEEEGEEEGDDDDGDGDGDDDILRFSRRRLGSTGAAPIVPAESSSSGSGDLEARGRRFDRSPESSGAGRGDLGQAAPSADPLWERRRAGPAGSRPRHGRGL